MREFDSDPLKVKAREIAVQVLMPRLTKLKDWQADKRATLRGRIALIRSGQGDHCPEVEAAFIALGGSPVD